MNPTALTEMVDRVFSDRYRIEELIGVGAISAVFSAYDSVDARRVALKVFDEALGADERFVDRLLDAVEQAAVLGHPNIVEIYDCGVDGGPYIVSELCEGGSLAALLEAGHILASSQALVVTLECARALNYGHEQGAIHRSLTPRNVLFTDDQQVRISDYGLAQVLADAPVAHASRALENVRYASPEQARGRPVGEASDLYSLALVVNEAVSGTPPHVAETVVGTLMERAESPATLDPLLGNLLPPLERCGRVDPEQRPEAEELTIALLAAAETMPRPDALPLVGLGNWSDLDETMLEVAGAAEGSIDAQGEDSADIDLVDAAGPRSGDSPDGEPIVHEDSSENADEDLDADAIAIAIDTADELAAGFDGAEADGAEFDASVLGELDHTDGFAQDNRDDPNPALDLVADTPVVGGLENLEQAEPVFAEVPGAPAEHELDVPEPVLTRRAAKLAYEEHEDDVDDKLPWWPLLVLGILIAGAVGAGVYFFALSDTAESAEVPDLIGVSFDQLGEVVSGRGWDIERLEDRIDGAVVGSIVAQSPGPGNRLDDGERLTVTVSLGNEMVEIPSDVIGLTVDQAASRLGTVGLTVGQLSEENNEGLGAGLVIGLDEPTTQMPSGQAVDLRISSGAEDRVVPANVVGMTIGDATSLLVGLRLQAVEEPAFSPDVEVGTVLASNPPAGEVVPADSVVTLLVSAGPEPVEMPDIVGLQLDEAIDVIEELGLIFIDTTGTPGEAVIGSLPPIGAIADVGTEVTIILNDPPEDEPEDG